MAGFWGKRKREQQELQEQDADLARRAGAALVATDERLRSISDELVFADAELGADATVELREALAAVRHHLGEAFHLNQLNHDDIPDTVEELRTRNARIVQLCEWADDLIDDRTGALAERIERARRAPEILAGIRADVARLTARLSTARAVVERVNSRYAPAAAQRVSGNPDEAAALLEFAEHGADVAERRRDAGERGPANVALEASMEAVRRAGTLLDAVDDFEVEALRAQSTLAAVVADSREDIVVARTAPQVPAVTRATAELERALNDLTPAGGKADPFAELTVLREKNAALDAAIALARERAARPLPDEAHVRHAIDDADRQLAVARSVISGHRGWIGADARTRLAEAESLRLGLASVAAGPIAEDDRERALADARRCGLLASEALQYAQRDIDSSRPDAGWGGPQGGWGGGRGGPGGNNVMGGILGGLVIGSLLDGMFD
ncbi:hypothetical protein NQ166_04580 [Microbacterium sp. zg.Y1090]|uniref:hypothetical protein n=1 Tax=Microbacterium TaxID=33882 RepID=UPI00214B4626|nr:MULTISPECIES: hypothetical protein [unclassified Microbacterium]MCR2813555.1 hypothetical protein [Microbacterium sp. zg.Y1084]MCR2818108.1 hypothetical protein [Microbacterium sp. zg.Y1090]MDL5486630.1 hypothetical protein [Microbacterium sp. zg-Y1211]WIM27736.1 hypothetical protein QNO26_11335 [Microbacterium sp. zg-Y1090]